MRPTQAGNAGCEAKVPRALIARLRAWRSMLLVPLQHRGSSLTTSVRPRAEKDCENTQGQVGLDGGHQRPEVGLLRGEMPSSVVFRWTNSSIRQPLASTGGFPAPLQVQHQAQMEPTLLCLPGPPRR